MAAPRFSIKSLLALTGVAGVLSAIASVWMRPEAPRGEMVTLGYGVALTAFTLTRLAGPTPKAPGRRVDAVLTACVVAFWAGLAVACYGVEADHRKAGLFLFLAAMPIGGATSTMAVGDAIALGAERVPHSANSSDVAPSRRATEKEP